MESIGFNVILKENVKEADIYQLQKILDAREYILSTEYITKEEAALETEQMLGEDFIHFLGYNPLPPSIRVRLHQPWTNPDSVMMIEQDLMQYEAIEEVYYKKSLLYAINENIRQIIPDHPWILDPADPDFGDPDQQYNPTIHIFQTIYHQYHAIGGRHQGFYTKTLSLSGSRKRLYSQPDLPGPAFRPGLPLAGGIRRRHLPQGLRFIGHPCTGRDSHWNDNKLGVNLFCS